MIHPHQTSDDVDVETVGAHGCAPLPTYPVPLPVLALLKTYQFIYRDLLRPLIFRADAMITHAHALTILRACDARPGLVAALAALHRFSFPSLPVHVGGVDLPAPVMLAAGFVKGDGFTTETEAQAAVAAGRNIIPGWRTMPALVGAVEFGSYTRYPRPGNPGTVLWRDAPTRSTQNRVGLKNPGAVAAAAFLATQPLPPVFGINIAVSPGVTDPAQEQGEAVEAFRAFLDRGVRPAWFTLNISCPNTEDDPGDHQTEARTRALCMAVLAALDGVPLWVKLGPDLAASQYRTLLRVLHEAGVRAVIATNTTPEPAPGQPGVVAGVGGGRLRQRALDVVRLLADERARHGYAVEVIGCGGVQTAADHHAFRQAGAAAVQYWSALIYQGPLAGAFILSPP